MTGEREWVPRTDAAQIAQRLRERREASGMTQPELARKVGVARSTYVHWERGRLPGTLATATVNALEAALQVPQGWLLRHGMLPFPDLGFDAANAAPHESGRDLLQARIPRARCQELGPHARRLGEELGLTVAEVARACAVSHPTLSQWEQATFPKVLTAQRLRAWERALLLAPGELLAPPASHPRFAMAGGACSTRLKRSKPRSMALRPVWPRAAATWSGRNSRWTRQPAGMPTCLVTAMALARTATGPWSTSPSRTEWRARMYTKPCTPDRAVGAVRVRDPGAGLHHWGGGLFVSECSRR
ncbi:helix-turn-helix domain-containing protein [Paraburkholderia sp. JPY169]|uniref:Helix-turn-helix domain-containing protein n=1 Tax=Paraburkholderia youngii TaxID=2782701 RepID=A0A7Y6MZ45_9BURK|nr:helix-turn-helix domain-containing protein [Paraburkholderia youngii]